ncbi:hypothetical protein PFISCL1PPCAC_22248, partial [Pristionchus fissidentatus]
NVLLVFFIASYVAASRECDKNGTVPIGFTINRNVTWGSAVVNLSCAEKYLRRTIILNPILTRADKKFIEKCCNITIFKKSAAGNASHYFSNVVYPLQ